ncbi:MAG: TlpA family protein disulfide reductase [Planctomycetia bacterium]|nr:TlpA family protein disulfide reductase [Planctomycetia bacterium]
MTRVTWIGVAAMFALSALGCGDSHPISKPGSTFTSGGIGAQPSTPVPVPATSNGDNTAGESTTAPDGVDVKVLSYEEIQKLIAGHKGKVVVVDCWSTSCAPCMKEFPGLVEIHKKYKDDVACVSVSFDYEGIEGTKPEDSLETVLGFLRRKGATFDNVVSNVPSDELYKKFEIGSIPVVFVYGRDGKVVKKFDGADGKEFTYKSDIEPLVAELVKKPAGAE